MEKSSFQSYLKYIRIDGNKIITPNIANSIAIAVNIPNNTVGIKFEKLKTEKPNAIVIDVVKQLSQLMSLLILLNPLIRVFS